MTGTGFWTDKAPQINKFPNVANDRVVRASSEENRDGGCRRDAHGNGGTIRGNPAKKH